MKISKIALLFCSALLLASGFFFYPRWQHGGREAQLSWDAGGYYWYLPSAFIHNDLKGQHFKDSILQRYKPTPPEDFQYGYLDSLSGNYVIRYTMGTAIMEAPFFFVAHVVAKPLGYPDDGFSLPYQFMIYLGGVLFALLGLILLRKLLLNYYADSVVGFVLILLVFGTNYLNYAGIDVGMTHSWLFTLYVFILINTHHYYRTFKAKYALRLGMLIGITTLIRPPEIISVLIPLLWGIDRLSFSVLRQRVLLFLSHRKAIIAAALVCVIIISLQFLYWHYATGRWFVYTYRDQGFSWLSPNFKKYPLDYQNGWLIYTPMMLFAIAGILIFLWSGKNRLAILSIIVINYYIVCAWKAYDYGGRAMIQNYPLLMFPLASFIEFILKRKIVLVFFVPFLVLCLYFNLWWTYQAHRGSLVGGAPVTKAYFLSTALRYDVPPELQKLRDNEDLYRGPPVNPAVLYPLGQNRRGEDSSFVIADDQQQSLSFPVIGPKKQWIRATADFHIEKKEGNVWFMTQFVIRLKKGDQVVQENSIRVQRFLGEGETKAISLDCRARSKDFDQIELLFRNDNNGTLPCYVSRIKVVSFDP